MDHARLKGASITVVARLVPVDQLVSIETGAAHVVGFTPYLDETYEVAVEGKAERDNVAFCVNDALESACALKGHVGPRPGIEDTEQDSMSIDLLPRPGVAPGEKDALASVVTAARRLDKFTGEWVQLDAQAPAMHCRVTVHCVVQR